MTPEQISTFRDSGYLLLRQALPRKQVEPIKSHVLDELKRLRIWSSGKALSAPIKEAPAFQQIAKLSSLIRQDDLHTRVIDKDTLATIVSLAGARLVPAQNQFLISLPKQGEWSLNGLSWHTDISPAGHRHVPGIQAFVLLDDVKPRGGATLAIAGSHVLADQPEPYRRVREVLRSKGDWQTELHRRNLSIVEMSGHAGDVYLMDMRLLHTPSINASGRLRIMATVRYLPAAHGAA
jgi:ectoine hydroxylase-related dioxygenase (phytanoyl-CoA dioxygenase family)